MTKKKTDHKGLAASIFLSLGWMLAAFLLLNENQAYKQLRQAKEDKEYAEKQKKYSEDSRVSLERNLAFYANEYAKLATKQKEFKDAPMLYRNGGVTSYPRGYHNEQ